MSQNFLKLGDQVPDFQVESSQGQIKFYDWAGQSWVMLFCHPKDRTPVCTTELGFVASMQGEFDQRNTKILALSLDDSGSHKQWIKEIEEYQKSSVNYPVIADTDRKIANMFGMIAQGESSTETVRSLFLINPQKKIRLRLDYPGAVGRNFDEVIRSLDALQLAEKENVVFPANWTPGEPAILRPSVSDKDAIAKYGENAVKKTKFEYLRFVTLPSGGQGTGIQLKEKKVPEGHLGAQPSKTVPS